MSGWRNGGLACDDGELLQCYRSAVRPGPWSANYVMEEPALLEARGDVRGQRVLDLCCGDASFGRAFRTRAAGATSASTPPPGCRRGTRNAAGTAGAVQHQTIERFASPPASFDVVGSRMAFHYVADLDSALLTCRDWLVPAGGSCSAWSTRS